jgi:hypothetical protein
MPVSIQEQYSAELQDLQNAYRQGRLNLYLGAGVSAASGLPTWKQLVVSMYFRYMKIERWQSIKPFPNYLYAIGEWYLNKTGESLDIIIRKLKSDLDERGFLSILYDCLYDQLNEGNPQNPFSTFYQNDLLVQITELVARTDRKINSVVTYNFDDLLEQALSSKSKNHTSVFNANTVPVNGSLPVYHPHGFMPFNDGNLKENSTGKIILSEDDYNTIANSSNYWANMVQTSLLTQGTGLMIGLSFSDRNLRRLIDLIANIPLHTNNYIFLKRNSMPDFTPEDSEEIKAKADSIADKMMRAGIKMNLSVYNNSKDILSELFQKDEFITYRVFESMKIKPIWFSEYGEVASFVRSIRE